MASDEEKQRRSQQVTTILLAANLYKSHKIDKGLQKMANLQEQALQQNQEMLANQDRANIIAETQLKIQLTQAQQIERTKLLKNTFFEISEEIEDVLKEKKITSVEKYFRYRSIKATIEKNGIETDITDDLSEKKLIRNAIKQVEAESSNTEKKFNKQDEKDLNEILEALEVDEESEIQKLSSSEVVKLTEKTKKLKEWYNKARNVGNGVGLFFVLASKSNKPEVAKNRKLAKENKKLILPNHFKDKSTAAKIFEYTGLESLDSILGPKTFEAWYNDKFKAFYSNLGYLDAGRGAGYMHWTSQMSFVLKTVAKGNYKSLFSGEVKAINVLSSWYKENDINSGTFQNLAIACKEAFNNPFPKSVFKKASDNPSAEAKEKISKLKKDIVSEKEKLKKILKKHPFIKTILSNR